MIWEKTEKRFWLDFLNHFSNFVGSGAADAPKNIDALETLPYEPVVPPAFPFGTVLVED